MRLSLCLDPGRQWPETVRLAGAAEGAGLDGLWAGYRGAGCDELVLRDHRDAHAYAVAGTIGQVVRLASAG